LSVKERIEAWLKEVKASGKPIEVVSFYQELPIRVKARLVDFDGKFLQWEAEPKLALAAADSGRLYFYFYDPLHQEKRLLSADVTYHGSSIVETTFPQPSQEPRFNRECLRVRASEKLPVKAYILTDEGRKELKVWDISEEGIGLIGERGSLNPGETVRVELSLPQGQVCLTGEVISAQPHEEGEKFGIKLHVRENEKKLLRSYIMARQREILNKIREVAG